MDKTHSFNISDPVKLGGLKMGDMVKVRTEQGKATIQKVEESESAGGIQESAPGKNSSENTP